jgi:propionate CoA-transferase
LAVRAAAAQPCRRRSGAAAAATLVEHVEPGAHVNIGTGLPEGVCDALLAAGLLDAITLLVESGPVGGLPAPGLFFGASFSPRKIISSRDVRVPTASMPRAPARSRSTARTM